MNLRKNFPKATKAKVSNFQEKIISFAKRHLKRMKQVEKRKGSFMEPLLEALKEDTKEREMDRKLLFCIRGVFRT